MSETKTKKLYVVAVDGRAIDGFGAREYGEFFELPEPVATELAERRDFSLRPPRATGAANDDLLADADKTDKFPAITTKTDGKDD